MGGGSGVVKKTASSITETEPRQLQKVIGWDFDPVFNLPSPTFHPLPPPPRWPPPLENTTNQNNSFLTPTFSTLQTIRLSRVLIKYFNPSLGGRIIDYQKSIERLTKDFLPLFQTFSFAVFLRWVANPSKSGSNPDTNLFSPAFITHFPGFSL